MATLDIIRYWYAGMQWLTGNGDRRTTCKDGCEKARTVGLGDYVDLDTGQDHDLRVENPDAR